MVQWKQINTIRRKEMKKIIGRAVMVCMIAATVAGACFAFAACGDSSARYTFDSCEASVEGTSGETLAATLEQTFSSMYKDSVAYVSGGKFHLELGGTEGSYNIADSGEEGKYILEELPESFTDGLAALGTQVEYGDQYVTVTDDTLTFVMGYKMNVLGHEYEVSMAFIFKA